MRSSGQAEGRTRAGERTRMWGELRVGAAVESVREAVDLVRSGFGQDRGPDVRKWSKKFVSRLWVVLLL